MNNYILIDTASGSQLPTLAEAVGVRCCDMFRGRGVPGIRKIPTRVPIPVGHDTLERSEGVPRNGVVSKNWFDCGVLSILYMFKPSFWPDVRTPFLGTPLVPLRYTSMCATHHAIYALSMRMILSSRAPIQPRYMLFRVEREGLPELFNGILLLWW